MSATLTAIAVDTREFVETVSWAAKAVPNNPAVPALGGMWLVADRSRLTVEAFDEDTHAAAAVDVDDSARGRWLVSGRLLDAVGKTFDLKRVTSLTPEDGKLTIRHGGARITLPYMDATGYPQLPAMPEPVGTADASAFASAVLRVAVATRSDAQPKHFAGVNLTFHDDRLKLEATDKYRGGIDFVPWSGAAEGSALVPADMLAPIVGALAAAGSEVTVSRNASLLGLACGNRRATLRQIAVEGNGRYPDVDELTPVPDSTVVRVAQGELLTELARATLFADVKVPAVIMTIGRDGMSVRGASEEGNADNPIECVVTGPDFTVGCNATYLAGSLKALGAGEVVLAFSNNPKYPFTVRAVGRHEACRHFIVPIWRPGGLA